MKKLHLIALAWGIIALIGVGFLGGYEVGRSNAPLYSTLFAIYGTEGPLVEAKEGKGLWLKDDEAIKKAARVFVDAVNHGKSGWLSCRSASYENSGNDGILSVTPQRMLPKRWWHGDLAAPGFNVSTGN